MKLSQWMANRRTILQNKIEIIMYQILDSESDTFGRIVFFWTAIGILFTHTLLVLSVIYGYLVWYTLRNRLVKLGSGIKRGLIFFISLNGLILVGFTIKNLFLTSRYPLALALLLLLYVPFALEAVYLKWLKVRHHSAIKTWKFQLLLLLLIANSYEGLTSISGHHHLKQQGNG